MKTILFKTNHNGKLHCSRFVHIDKAPAKMPSARDLAENFICQTNKIKTMENHTVVIQIKLSNDRLGTMSELGYRHKIEDDFRKILKPLNTGYCDGGQMGAGTMEIFIEKVTDIDFALDVILQHLKSLEIKPEYKVAWRKNTPSNLEKYKVAFATNKNRLFSFSFFDFE